MAWGLWAQTHNDGRGSVWNKKEKDIKDDGIEKKKVEEESLSLSLSLRSVIDHLLSDDGRTDLGIKDEWLNIPDLNMKKSPWSSKSSLASWFVEIASHLARTASWSAHKCQILDIYGMLILKDEHATDVLKKGNTGHLWHDFHAIGVHATDVGHPEDEEDEEEDEGEDKDEEVDDNKEEFDKDGEKDEEEEVDEKDEEDL